ncbi:hypothetical protein GC177_10200 [bacterium]|nr:hypothetical protein [bacterium]
MRMQGKMAKHIVLAALLAGTAMLGGCEYLSTERTPDPINNARRSPSMNPGGDGYVHWRTPEEEWRASQPQSAMPLSQNVAQMDAPMPPPAPTMQAAPVQPVIVQQAPVMSAPLPPQAQAQDAQLANIAPAYGVPPQAYPAGGQNFGQPQQYAQAQEMQPMPPAMDQYVAPYSAPQGRAPYPTLGQVPATPDAAPQGYYQQQVQQLESDRSYNQQMQMNAPQPEPFYAPQPAPQSTYTAPQTMQQGMATPQPVSAPWYPVPPSDPSGQSYAQPEMQNNVQVQQAVAVAPQLQPQAQPVALQQQPQSLGRVPAQNPGGQQLYAAPAITLNPPQGYSYGARQLMPVSRYEARRVSQNQTQAQTRLY